MNAGWIPLMAGICCFSACVVENTGPVQHDSRAIDRDQAEWVRVNISIGAGKLRVGSSGDKLMRADFFYNVPSWKPDVRYTTAAGHGSLSIRQPNEGHGHFGNTRYEWDLRFNPEVPLEMAFHCGAGEATLDLSALKLRDVDVQMGVGKLDMDLRGTPKQSYDVRIRGGVGDATVHLPESVGIDAEARGGIGEIRVNGLHKEGQHWVNDAYQSSKVVIHLDIQGGVGSIKLIAGGGHGKDDTA
jgi:uncharacterized protein DUF2154